MRGTSNSHVLRLIRHGFDIVLPLFCHHVAVSMLLQTVRYPWPCIPSNM